MKSAAQLVPPSMFDEVSFDSYIPDPNEPSQAEAVAKARDAFGSPVIVAVVSSPQAGHKVPEWEQFLSAGAVCLSLLNAALGAGWGAAWLSGPATDAAFSTAHLGVRDGERVVGMIHIGSRTGEVPDRPRPDVPAKTVFL